MTNPNIDKSKNAGAKQDQRVDSVVSSNSKDKDNKQNTRNHVCKPVGSTHKRKKVGRGTGSKKGGTSGVGHKGYLARSGVSDLLVFEGGQIPIVRKMPKFGFSNAPFKKNYQSVKLGRIEKKYNAGEEVNLTTLKAKKLISSRYKLAKIVGGGELKKEVKIAKEIAVTKSVEKSLQKSGSTRNK